MLGFEATTSLSDMLDEVIPWVADGGGRRSDLTLVAVCSAEAYTEAPAGPALRAAGLARGLAATVSRSCSSHPPGSRAPDGCGLVPLDDVGGLVERGATMVVSGFLLERYPVLARARHLVVDAAGPFLLENLVVHQTQTPERRRRVLADESAVLAPPARRGRPRALRARAPARPDARA